jgi:hypothetical protein
MLKASLMPHVKDYSLEVKYGSDVDSEARDIAGDEDFEIVEKVTDALVIKLPERGKKGIAEQPKKPISLFDPTIDLDKETTEGSQDKYTAIPPVTEPKILQAPFVIPPLYPFSRTTVYLLLSPETTQKKPKAVVLRGTSAHGPLELEIPVTVLSEKGETVHQLAARKAVKELEEGRGWIYHAKDADGNLLKEKHQGRFSDMVEREAVNLGVRYQVGGKWCSFVAVEEESDREVAEPQHSYRAPDLRDQYSQRMQTASATPTRKYMTTTSSVNNYCNPSSVFEPHLAPPRTSEIIPPAQNFR